MAAVKHRSISPYHRCGRDTAAARRCQLGEELGSHYFCVLLARLRACHSRCNLAFRLSVVKMLGEDKYACYSLVNTLFELRRKIFGVKTMKLRGVDCSPKYSRHKSGVVKKTNRQFGLELTLSFWWLNCCKFTHVTSLYTSSWPPSDSYYPKWLLGNGYQAGWWARLSSVITSIWSVIVKCKDWINMYVLVISL